eukprot:8263188-Karenia_brevis.AAC.1
MVMMVMMMNGIEHGHVGVGNHGWIHESSCWCQKMRGGEINRIYWILPESTGGGSGRDDAGSH